MNSREILIIVYSISLILLLFLSFFFSSSDMAYGSVDILRFEREKDNPKKSVKYAYKLAKNYDKTISTILLLNDTVNAGLDSISTLLGVNLAFIILGSAYPNIDAVAENWGLIASMICLVTKIIFGEIIAKSIGKIYNFKFSILYSKIIRILDFICIPITFIVSSFGKIVTYPITHNVEDVRISEDDLHEMVDDIEAQGGVDEKQADLLHDAIYYTKTEAYEIMTPRVDIYAIDIDDDINEVIKDPKMYRFTRVPVYQDTIDNIIGYVNTKTLMLLSFQKKDIDLRNLLITPLRFPRSIEINEILNIFRKEKQHFGLIIDEYGGIEGLITMEDILEELVGDIWDEKDDPNAAYTLRKDGKYIIDGGLNLEDFCNLFSLNYDELDTEYVTIGGFCIELLDDKFAKVNDVIEYKDLKMKVIAIDKNHSIEKLLVEKIKKDEPTSYPLMKIFTPKDEDENDKEDIKENTNNKNKED